MGRPGHDGGVSTLWSAPDPRRAASPPGAVRAPFAAPYVVAAPAHPTLWHDAFAGLLAAVVTVLVGAPVGLLWAAVAPTVDVVVDGDQVQLVEPGSSAFIATDGFFLFAVALAGVVGGVLAWRLAHPHGPAVVVGLTLGGLAAAYVAMVVGEQVGLAEVQQAVQAGQQGALELTVRLRAEEALVGWPVGALVGYAAASLLRGR
ncbi:MAG: DUF2567 domain-containing protein [Frankiales bacterium]|nr:MAG: DUF2567 domain-containing protein [Frankiales bacterium]